MTAPALDGAHLTLDHQRALLDDARRDLSLAALRERDARRRLADVARAASPRHPETLAAARRAAEAVEKAALARTAAAARVAQEQLRLKGDLGGHVELSPEAEVARLSAALPLVLLPVRLETRFSGGSLLVRVYPDDIFADTHEPELTDTEIADGQRFWTDAWPGESEERLAWRALVTAAGAERAAWIAKVLTPSNLAQRPAGAAAFPAVARRPTTWTRGAEARLLPDRWLVLVYRDGEEVTRKSGDPIVEPLALTLSPSTEAGDRAPLPGGGQTVDNAVSWTVDFVAAEAAGMGITVPLEPEDQERGFDRVLVLGVKSSLAPDRSALELEALLENHRFGRGVAIVPQGTPTNNSADGPTPFPPRDPDASASYRARIGVGLAPGHDGARLMRALGLPLGAASHWSGADGTREAHAVAMARALWPTTLGYFLEQLMAPVFSAAAIREAKQFFVDSVRGGGALPAFRVGNTPYGVLATAGWSRWRADEGARGADRELPGALQTLASLWLSRATQVPRVGATQDPDADLIGILGMEASAREVRIRSVVGEDAQWNLFGLFGFAVEWPAWLDGGQLLAQRILDLIGHSEWKPRIARLNFGTAWPFAYRLVTEDPLSEQTGLAPNYIDWIAGASAQELRDQSFPGGSAPVSLLFRLLRHGALLELHDAALHLQVVHGLAEASEAREPELVGLPGRGAVVPRIARMEQAIPAISGRAPIHTFLQNPNNAALLGTLLGSDGVTGLRDALRVLAPLPTAELDRLTGETLDAVTHRLDAWITALASRRLERMRTQAPAGCHLGAFGWVEDLRPRPAGEPVKVPGGRVATRQAGNGGYIHAPSMTHAAAAAVLRNAYLSRAGTDRSRYAVDLSSARVRLGRFILDAVREGQPVGAVLGYRIERGLHERKLDVLIAPLRSLYPLVAGKSNDPADEGEPTEQIAARNVVDGLALRRAFVAGQVPWGTSGLPDAGPARDALTKELEALDAAADAVTDLLLSESVYQLVKGSPSVAAATLDAMAQGTVRPPDPEIATQPRRGTPLTHRVALVLGEGGAVLPAAWGPPTLRAAVEPRLDAWLGSLLGEPTRVKCSVRIEPAGGPVQNTDVSLAELGVRPIDLLALARASAEPDPAAQSAAASELDRRIQAQAYQKLGVADEVKTAITYALPAGADRETARSFGDVLEVARALVDVLGRSRVLQPEDLLPEDRGDAAATADRDPADALARATAARGALNDCLTLRLQPAIAAAAAALDTDPLDLTALRAALAEAALGGVPSAYPLTSAGQSLAQRKDLLAQARSVAAELTRRVTRADEVLAEAALPAHAGDAVYQVRAARDAVGIILGPDAPFIPLFRPAEAPELTAAMVYGLDAAFVGASPAVEISRFELVAARVRTALDAWRRLDLLRGALGGPAAAPLAVQLPYEAAARWAARPFEDESSRPRPGRTSILLHRAATPAATDRWAGLLLDHWTEVIPAKQEQTGVAFHYDDAGAEAPQTILVAVPRRPSKRWDLESLVATVGETLELAKIRAVDGELLGELGQLLPAVYLPDSTGGATVGTSFVGALRQEMAIAPARES